MVVTKVFDNSKSKNYEHDVLYSFVSTLSEISKSAEQINEHSILFIACDFSKYSIDELSGFADSILDRAVAFVCTWGKGCEKTHDIIDEIAVYREVVENKSPSHPMTTWHSDETIDEALWFALFSAFPDDSHEQEDQSTLIVVVENEQWNRQVLSRLSNIDAFNREILEEEEN